MPTAVEAKLVCECESLGAQLQAASGWRALAAEGEARAAEGERIAQALRAELKEARAELSALQAVHRAAEESRLDSIAANEELHRMRTELTFSRSERSEQIGARTAPTRATRMASRGSAK